MTLDVMKSHISSGNMSTAEVSKTIKGLPSVESDVMLERDGTLPEQKLERKRSLTHDLIGFAKHNMNPAVSFLLLASQLYLTYLAIFEISFLDPFQTSNSMTQDNFTDGTTPREEVNAIFGTSTLSILVIVLAGLAGAALVQFCRLPGLLGMLLAGILLRNMPYTGAVMLVVKEWGVVLRRLAFIVILLRGGLSLDANALRKLKGACFRLALIPCTVEAVAVAAASRLILGMDILYGLMLGFVLAAVSPAVIVPAMLDAAANVIMFKLDCSYQNYAWGKLGADSEVAQLVKEGGHAPNVDDSKPYAELWMGVHKNGPSKIRGQEQLLANLIQKETNMVGAHEKGSLQFLFKVLSVRSALSVQTHPTKEQAALLHAKDPKNYPDANHKPEMAIALTKFQLLCGFRPANEIHDHIRACPELLSLLDGHAFQLELLMSGTVAEQQAALRVIFTIIWNSPQDEITAAVHNMITRIKVQEKKSELDELLIRLDSEYPGGDVGVFAPLILNYFTLAPGEATFLGPNRPHAYLFGDCIECMAASDNTIRAGLTPKYKDIHTLCSNLQYTMSGPPLFPCSQQADGVRLYAPAVPEFAVQEIRAHALPIACHGSSSLIIVISGAGLLDSTTSQLAVTRGDVVFSAASLAQIQVRDATSDFLAFRAYTPAPQLP